MKLEVIEFGPIILAKPMILSWTTGILWIDGKSRSFRGKQIIYDEEDELQENNSGFLQSGTMQYQTREGIRKGICNTQCRRPS
ncbi:hypothetical protein K7X08_034608 [Anisodus acutangulus]|uniref:Uncharacterized protein n=1 Tax=Anisodus acutangulus TaxID=402998 RepID=A0A9Q1R345_9SOLA|nr:hypothetical protein K7X08_034608 [Anisodus acutangulus]